MLFPNLRSAEPITTTAAARAPVATQTGTGAIRTNSNPPYDNQQVSKSPADCVKSLLDNI